MKNILLTFITALTATILFSGCHKTDLTASYIYIDSAAIYINMANYNQIHGTNYDAEELASIASQRFSDAWIFVDGQDLGTWEIPCRIPILGSDSAEIKIYPGFKMNGSSTTRPRYPFVDPYTFHLPLLKGEVQTFTSIPVTYTSTSKYEFIETFNTDYNGIFHTNIENGINFEHIIDPDNSSNRIGKLALTDTVTEFELVSNGMSFQHVLPTYAFLEMDYRCDIENAQLSVGVLVEKTNTTIITNEPLVIANAGSQWKKIYINLTQAIARNQTYARNFRIQITGGRAVNNPVNFYFDNIKVIYQ